MRPPSLVKVGSTYAQNKRDTAISQPWPQLPPCFSLMASSPGGLLCGSWPHPGLLSRVRREEGE